MQNTVTFLGYLSKSIKYLSTVKLHAFLTIYLKYHNASKKRPGAYLIFKSTFYHTNSNEITTEYHLYIHVLHFVATNLCDEMSNHCLRGRLFKIPVSRMMGAYSRGRLIEALLQPKIINILTRGILTPSSLWRIKIDIYWHVVNNIRSGVLSTIVGKNCKYSYFKHKIFTNTSCLISV